MMPRETREISFRGLSYYVFKKKTNKKAPKERWYIYKHKLQEIQKASDK